MKALGELTTVVKGRSYRSPELADSEVAPRNAQDQPKCGGGYSDKTGRKRYSGSYRPSVQSSRTAICCLSWSDVALTLVFWAHGRGALKPALVQGSPAYDTLFAAAGSTGGYDPASSLDDGPRVSRLARLTTMGHIHSAPMLTDAKVVVPTVLHMQSASGATLSSGSLSWTNTLAMPYSTRALASPAQDALLPRLVEW